MYISVTIKSITRKRRLIRGSMIIGVTVLNPRGGDPAVTFLIRRGIRGSRVDLEHYLVDISVFST